MKKKGSNRFLIALFLLSLGVFLIVTNLNKPRILILHSYYTDYSWVRDINEGLDRIFKKYSYNIRYHYMDTKRHTDNNFKMKAGQTAIKMIEQWKPDVILSIDDNAQQMSFKEKEGEPKIPPLPVTKRFLNNPKFKIVFTGVNASARKYGYDKGTNVTGILERIPFQSFKEIFLKILPEGRRRIVHISDNSTTSDALLEELKNIDWSPLELPKDTNHILCNTFDDWKKAIREAPEKGNILLVTHYHTIKKKKGDKKNMKPSDVIKWTKENSKLPQIGCWGFFVEDGGMMAVAVSPYEQGEEAAKMVVNMIEKGTPPSKIPIITSKLYLMYVNAPQLNSYHITLPELYEAFARATNTYFTEK